MSALVSLSPGVACAVLSMASLLLRVPTAQQCRVPPFVRKMLTTQLPFVVLCCLAMSSSGGDDGATATENGTGGGMIAGNSDIAGSASAGVANSEEVEVEGGGYVALVFSMLCYALFLIIAPKRRLVLQSSRSSNSSFSSPVADDLSAATATASFMLTLAFCSRSAFSAAFTFRAILSAALLSLLLSLTSYCATVLPLLALPCAFATAAPLGLIAEMALGMGGGYYHMNGVGMVAACVVAALSLGVANALRKATDDAVGLAGLEAGDVWYVNDGSMGVKGAQRGWVEMMLAMMPPVVAGVIPNSVGGGGKRAYL